jgi:hypothetical protein
MNGETIFIIISALAAIFIIISFYTRGKKAKSIFPPIDTVNIIYRDKSASGYSTKSLKTKVSGANNTLDIVVTDSELWLTSKLLLASIGNTYDLLHRIPLDSILRVESKGKKITIDFKNQDNEDKQVVVMTKNMDEFFKALKV